MSYTAQTNIAVPSGRTGAQSPLRTFLGTLPSGSSVFVPLTDFPNVKNPASSIANTASSAFGKGNYTVRNVTEDEVEGCRIWNTTDTTDTTDTIEASDDEADLGLVAE